jgi:hypothetical protein
MVKDQRSSLSAIDTQENVVKLRELVDVCFVDHFGVRHHSATEVAVMLGIPLCLMEVPTQRFGWNRARGAESVVLVQFVTVKKVNLGQIGRGK